MKTANLLRYLAIILILVSPHQLYCQTADTSLAESTNTSSSGVLNAPEDTLSQEETTVTSANTLATNSAEDQGYGSPLLLGIIIFYLILCFFTILAGILLGCLLLGLLVLLTIGGVIGTSLLVGLYKKSLTKGFNTFLVLASAVFGIGTSALVGSIRNFFFKQVETFQNIDSYLAVGAISGFALGFALIKIFKKIFEFLIKKYHQLSW